jgi:hypothetical protein
MKGRSIAFAFLVVGLSLPTALDAQSLGEIARKAREARVKAKEEQAKVASTEPVTTKEGAKGQPALTSTVAPKKLYTNKDLPDGPDALPVVPTAPAPEIDTTALKAVKAATPTFEPLYHSAMAVQGATGSGVSYVRFRELLQGLSGEVGIAKDRQLNAADSQLLALFQRVLNDYQTSAEIWAMKLAATELCHQA